MPISGLDELQSRICRKNNPSPRAAQAYFYNCTTEFSFQYDKQTLRPSHVLVSGGSSSGDMASLVNNVIVFATKVVKELVGLDTSKAGPSSMNGIVIPVLLGSYVVAAFDENTERSASSMKKLAELASTAQLSLLHGLFSSASQGVTGLELFLRALGVFLKYVAVDFETSSNNGYESISLATISKCSLYRALRLVDLNSTNFLSSIDEDQSIVENSLANVIDCISQVVSYDILLTKNLSKSGDNPQRQKSILYELSATAASLAFAGHLFDQIIVTTCTSTKNQSSGFIGEILPKKAGFSKVTSNFVTKLATKGPPTIVGLDSHSLSLLWALHKIYISTRQPAFLQQCFLLTTAWITSSTTDGNSEEISRRCRFPFVPKILKDIYSNVDKTASAKMWLLAVEQLAASPTLFQLWRSYVDLWSSSSINSSPDQQDENMSPLKPVPTAITNRYSLSRAVLSSSKTVASAEDRIAFMFKELNVFASAGPMSQFATEMRTILRLLAEATSKSAATTMKLENLLVRVKTAELILACWQNEFADIAVDGSESCLAGFTEKELPVARLLAAQANLLNFMRIWYERQTSRPDDVLVSPSSQPDLLKSFGIVIPDAANRPNCNCFDHAIITPKLTLEHAESDRWLQLLRRAADLLINVDLLTPVTETLATIGSIVAQDAINTIYTCAAFLLLMREHVRALSCYLRLKSWLSESAELSSPESAWNRRLDRLLLQIRIHLLDTGLDGLDSACSSSSVGDLVSSQLKGLPDTLSLRMRLFCATTTCSSSAQAESSGSLVDCPAHSKPLGKCTPLCRWLVSSPLCTSFWASTHALSETFSAYDRSKPVRAKHFLGLKSLLFGDTILKFADLLDALYFASEVALVAGVFRDAARAAYEGLRYSIRFAATKWIYTFQLQMLESLKFQDKIQHASHYKLLTDASVPDSLIEKLMASKEVDDLLLGGRLSLKYKIWHQLHARLGDDSETRLLETAEWLKSNLSEVTLRVREALAANSTIKQGHCSIANPLADTHFAAWLHFFDFATRFPGNDLELNAEISTTRQDDSEASPSLSRVCLNQLPALPTESRSSNLSIEDLAKVFAPRKPSYEALSIANFARVICTSPGKEQKLRNTTGKNSSKVQRFDETSLQIARCFPLAPVYSELCRLRAVRSYATGASPMVTAYWLHEANTVCFRHMLRAVLAIQHVSSSKLLPNNSESQQQNRDEVRHLKEIRLLTRFPPVFEDFVESVKEIPSQWTVISLSILPPANETAPGGGETPHRMAAVCWWRARHRRDQPEVRFVDAASLLLLLMRFEQLMLENEESLRLKTRKEFWKCRLDIDRRMSALMDDADTFVKGNLLPSELQKKDEELEEVDEEEVGGARPVVVLMLDAWTTPFSWEDVPSMRGLAVTRGLTLPFLAHQLRTALRSTPGCELVSSYQFVKWPIQSVSYVLDPENNLAKTRATFEPIVTTRTPSWTGFVGRFPSSRELLDQLRRTQMFVFIGHGSGLHSTSFRDLGDQKLVAGTGPEDAELAASSSAPENCGGRATAIGVLMGCSSLRLVDFRRRDLHNSALFFPLALSPAVFGNLFNVTDIDIDRFLMGFLDEALTPRWRHGFEGNKDHPAPTELSDQELAMAPRCVSLLAALTKARSNCKLRFLNGSAPVCYGLPLAITRECLDL